MKKVIHLDRNKGGSPYMIEVAKEAFATETLESVEVHDSSGWQLTFYSNDTVDAILSCDKCLKMKTHNFPGRRLPKILTWNRYSGSLPQ